MRLEAECSIAKESSVVLGANLEIKTLLLLSSEAIGEAGSEPNLSLL